MNDLSPHWAESALCAQTDPDAFYPEKGAAASAVKRICQRCEVRPQCLQHALDNDERFGIWGGKSQAELERIRKGRAG